MLPLARVHSYIIDSYEYRVPNPQRISCQIKRLPRSKLIFMDLLL